MVTNYYIYMLTYNTYKLNWKNMHRLYTMCVSVIYIFFLYIYRCISILISI